MTGSAIHSPEDRRFVGKAAGVLDDVLVRDPVHATWIGDHRFDSRLPDLTPDGVAEQIRMLRRHLRFLDGVDERSLSRSVLGDRRILRSGLARRLFELEEIGEHLWNPMLWNPAEGLYTLTGREFTSVPARARSLVGRLLEVPNFLDNARHTLGEMPRVHVETAIEQLGQVEPMLAGTLGPMADQPGVAAAVDVAVGAIDEHIRWLTARLPGSNRDPAVGQSKYSGVLRHILESDLSAGELLELAYRDLDRVSDELASMSASYLGRSMAEPDIIQLTMAALAGDGRVSGDGVLDVCEEVLRRSAEFLERRRLVTVPPLNVRIEIMPPVRRGVSVAYCDAPGPLESGDVATVIGISPVPDSWSRQRRESYYREYNRHLLYDLMVHEGLPGHLLQTARARQVAAPTDARAVFPSGLFTEGWAVYAEELMAKHGFLVDAEHRGSFRLMQLKMRLRGILNTVLDIGIHTQGMTEADARKLLSSRGLQEEGEIAGKWRRAQLSYGQLATYYVGYRGVAELIRDVSGHQRQWSRRQVHDSVLSHGAVSPQHLRVLTGLE